MVCLETDECVRVCVHVTWFIGFIFPSGLSWFMVSCMFLDMSVLTPADGLCPDWYIYSMFDVTSAVPR
jgi:hypothetical protein